MSVSIPEEQLNLILDRLDGIETELLRLRAMLLPEEEPTPEERAEIRKAREEIAKGSRQPLEKVLQDLS